MTTFNTYVFSHRKMQNTQQNTEKNTEQNTDDSSVVEQDVIDIEQYEDLCISIKDLRTQLSSKAAELKEYQESVYGHMDVLGIDTMDIGTYTFTRSSKMRCKWNKKALLKFAEGVDTGTFEESISQYERECSEEQTIYSRKKRKTC